MSKNFELSILIPARNEMFLAKTIEDILSNIEADTEIIAILDGAWADPVINDNKRVTLVYLPESIGQRAATNLACKLSTAKYIMKVDAHCAFDKGFDRKMIAEMKDDWTMVPTMRNLHAFDWVCPDGHRRYQGPSGPCKDCGKPTVRDVVWIPKKRPESNSYCFDATPHFQYFNEFNSRPESKGDLTESMSIQGSCFMVAREKYWELDLSDETFGSWGSQGIEVACKTWLSGGRVIINHKTWYAHLFRTQGGDFSFPYPQKENKVQEAKAKAKDLFFNNKWEKQIYPLSWLLKKFWPVKGWTAEDLAKLKGGPTKGIIYYTDNRLKWSIAKACRKQLLASGLPIVSVSLKTAELGKNIVIKAEPSVLTMFRQILAGLEASTADIVFFCEHDVLYHPSHFDFTPLQKNVWYFNVNVWKVDYKTDKALKVDNCQQVSGMCAYRDFALNFYREKVRQVELGNFDKHYEPKGKKENWSSKEPIIDIRHDNNLTSSRWSKEKFNNKKYTKGWTESTVDKITGWNNLEILRNNF